ncbi:MAG: Crp/Fnr family transcriptional regulator [Bacillota bacterium]|nr:Crp/Fnr family transcriptional regulator [Bacillota bacterium]
MDSIEIENSKLVVKIKANEEDIRLVKIFENINKDTSIKLKQFVSKKTLHKGDMLLYEQQEVSTVYFVIRGKVNIYKTTQSGQKKIIYLLSDGAMINEDVFGRGSSIVACEAFEEATILYLSKEKLLELMKEDFNLTQDVILSMSKKMGRLYRQLKNSVATRIDRKIAAKLLKLSKDYGKEIDKGILIDLNITITYLSEMLGHSRENISKAIKQLESQGLLCYKNKKIIIDREKLLNFHKSM